MKLPSVPFQSSLDILGLLYLSSNRCASTEEPAVHMYPVVLKSLIFNIGVLVYVYLSAQRYIPDV